jgi:N-acetylneuraminic acid mutarotase
MQYDPATRKWKRMADLPVDLSRSAWFVINGQAYVIGRNQETWVTEILKYNEANDSWSKFSQLPGKFPPNVYGVMSLNSKAYILAGTDNAALLEFDPQLNTYTNRKALVFNVPSETVDSYALSSSSYGLFFFNKKVWRYDPVNDSWLDLNAPSDVEWNPLVLDNILYMFGLDYTYVYAIE